MPSLGLFFGLIFFIAKSLMTPSWEIEFIWREFLSIQGAYLIFYFGKGFAVRLSVFNIKVLFTSHLLKKWLKQILKNIDNHNLNN